MERIKQDFWRWMLMKRIKQDFWRWRIKQDFWRWIYKNIYKFNIDDINGTMLPDTGKGKYVSVYSKGKIIQIVDESGEYDEIRIIPCQFNHGVMVEKIKDDKLHERTFLNIGMLNNDILYSSNLAELLNEKKLQRKVKLNNINKNNEI
jgi:hypothetical protein